MPKTDESSKKLLQVSPPASETTPRSTSVEETRQELREAIDGSNQVLAQATTALALFPDTIILDRAKLTIIKRPFFRMAEVTSMRIEDVLNVACTVGPFLGTITIVSRVMSSDQTTDIGKFWREDAQRVKRIAQGYVIALQRNIDCSKLPTRDLASMLEKLGTDVPKPV